MDSPEAQWNMRRLKGAKNLRRGWIQFERGPAGSRLVNYYESEFCLVHLMSGWCECSRLSLAPRPSPLRSYAGSASCFLYRVVGHGLVLRSALLRAQYPFFPRSGAIFFAPRFNRKERRKATSKTELPRSGPSWSSWLRLNLNERVSTNEGVGAR